MTDRVIHKVRLVHGPTRTGRIASRHDPRIVHVGADVEGFPAVWYEHGGPGDTDIELSMLFTGEPFDPATVGRHAGSYVYGTLVWHIYARTTERRTT